MAVLATNNIKRETTALSKIIPLSTTNITTIARTTNKQQTMESKLFENQLYICEINTLIIECSLKGVDIDNKRSQWK
jgi:hypothetical protein